MTIKTPKEIKRGLECCRPVWTGERWKTCDTTCPYLDTEEEPCKTALHNDALALIRQLEAKLDAALDHIRGECAYCAYLPGDTIPDVCVDCANKGFYRWEFRDGQKED